MALSVIDGALEHSFDVLGGAARHFRSGSIRDSHYKGLSHISCPPRAPSSVKIDHNLFYIFSRTAWKSARNLAPISNFDFHSGSKKVKRGHRG